MKFSGTWGLGMSSFYATLQLSDQTNLILGWGEDLDLPCPYDPPVITSDLWCSCVLNAFISMTLKSVVLFLFDVL